MIRRSSTDAYRIEPLAGHTLPDIEHLHAAVYRRRPPAGSIAKKYDTSFTGVGPIGYIAYAGTVPVAFYGVLPCFVRVAGEQVLAAQSADTMTHPGHRNKGLFVRLAIATADRCRCRGIRLLFGFPNQHSAPGFIGRLGWRSPGTIDHFTIRAGNAPPACSPSRLPLIRTAIERRRRAILEEYRARGLGIASSVMMDGYDGIDRDDAWFGYKTYHRSHFLDIAGSTVWLKAARVLVVGDIATTPTAFAGVIDALTLLAFRLGAGEIHFHACPGTTLHRLFADIAAPVPSFPLIFKSFDATLSIDRIKFTSADIDIF